MESKLKPDKEKLLSLNQRMTRMELAKQFDVTDKTISNWLHSYGIPSSYIPSKKPSKGTLKSLCKGKCDREVAKLFDVENSTIGRWRKSYGIKHSLVDVNSLREKF